MEGNNDRVDSYNWARDILKLVAIIAMTMDHVATYLMPHGSTPYDVCQFFGNFTIVIISYFIVSGVKYTHSVKRYIERMIVWALVSQVPFYLLRHDYELNVLVTLLASLIGIYLLDKKGWLYYCITFAVFFPISLFSDWAFLPLIFTMIFYESDKHNLKWLPIVLLPIVMFISRLVLSNESLGLYISEAVAFLIISTVIYLLRNKTEQRAKGRIPGLFFYAYYPLHLFVIWLIAK